MVQLSGTEEEICLPPERRIRVVVAWLLLWLMLSGSGVLAFFLLVFTALFFLGGADLLSDVLARQETKAIDYSVVIYTSIFLGIPPGAWLGVHLWSKLMRWTDFISDERIKKMSGV